MKCFSDSKTTPYICFQNGDQNLALAHRFHHVSVSTGKTKCFLSHQRYNQWDILTLVVFILRYWQISVISKLNLNLVDHATQPLWSPLFLCVSASSSRLPVPLSRFLILDLPKIALTGDINGLLLVSSWLLQIFGKWEREGTGKKRKRKREYGSPPPTSSRRSLLLFDSLPESVPPIETALQMLLLRLQRRALYEKNVYFGPQRFRAVVLSKWSTARISLPMKTLFYSLPGIFLD